MKYTQSTKIHPWAACIYYLSFSLILFGLKLWQINSYGNATPFWDQWDAEAAYLYIPYLEGTYRLIDLFSPHNEHRIAMTRLLSLLLLEINGVWNPLLQMVINAILHIVAILICNFLLVLVIGKKWLYVMLAFSLILFGMPYGWENTLAGFQSQFYLVVLFSIFCMWFTVLTEPLSVRWWCGVASGMLAYFSLASGVFAFAASLVTTLCVLIVRLEYTVKNLTGVAILVILLLSGLYLTPVVEGHSYLKADTFGHFMNAIFTNLGWPLISNRFYAGIFAYLGLHELGKIVAIITINLPAVIFVIHFLGLKSPVRDKRWFLVAMVLWSTLQMAGIAYGRADNILSSRYFDLYAFGLLLNFSCLLLFAAENKSTSPIRIWFIVLTWISLVLVSLTVTSYDNARNELVSKYDTGLLQENNVRNYLLTQDVSYLKDKPVLSIPYPNADRLVSILESKTILDILPANLRADQSEYMGRLDAIVSYTLRNWILVIILGVTLLVSFKIKNGNDRAI